MKFRGWLQLGVRRAYLATICCCCFKNCRNSVKLCCNKWKKMPRLNNDERNQAVGMLNACRQLLYHGTLVVLERLSSLYGDDSVSQETLPTIHVEVGQVWPLLPMMAISSCSTDVQASDCSSNRKTVLYSSTDCQKSVDTTRSPDVIEQQGGMDAAVTCTSDILIAIWFCFLMNVGLTLAMPSGKVFYDACVIERDLFGGGLVLDWGGIIYSVTLTAWAAISQCALHKMVDTWETDTFHWIFTLFFSVDTPPNEF